MNRLFLLLWLVLCHQSSQASVFKCVNAGGKVQYQSAPCDQGRQLAVKAMAPSVPTAAITTKSSKPSAAPLSSPNRACVGKEMRINFTSMPLRATLQVIADYAGHQLVMDPAISGDGAFNYECVPWDAVLQDIASRHKLAVKIQNGAIHASKR
jgi:Domain of unknown function (DUF4124)